MLARRLRPDAAGAMADRVASVGLPAAVPLRAALLAAALPVDFAEDSAGLRALVAALAAATSISSKSWNGCPQLALADLKKGDAVIVSSRKVSDGSPLTAFAFVAGVEPFLAAAPRTAGQVNLGSWNLDVGVPEAIAGMWSLEQSRMKLLPALLLLAHSVPGKLWPVHWRRPRRCHATNPAPWFRARGSRCPHRAGR